MSIYTDTIRRWAADDRRAGRLADADGCGEVGLGSEEAGTRLAVRFTLRLRGDRAETVRYQVFGCGFTVAACAAAADLAEGRTLAEVARLGSDVVDTALGGLPADRGYCAALAVEALQAAVKSVLADRQPVAAEIAPDDDHAPRITDQHPLYRLLIDSPAPRGVPADDRHLFACTIAVTAGDPGNAARVLGLSREELADLLQLYFPEIHLADLREHFPDETTQACSPSRPDSELLQLILDYLPQDSDGWTPAPSLWLARIIAARAVRPGHLWQAMGLFARPELTAAIRRHLPALAAANGNGMRWKRFLYKTLCERNGGMMCKTPDCRDCSDYAQCFAG